VSFRNALHKSEAWYYTKFREYEFTTEFVVQSTMRKEEHQKRKLDSIMDDLEEMEGEIPILEIDESLKGLQKSERWYYDKFQFHNLELSRPIHSEGMKEAHAERKINDIVSDLEYYSTIFLIR
jgi:hypothetical protein